MSDPVTEVKPAKVEKVDPFRFGWRFVKTTDANGKVVTVQQPLTFEDVLHPQEEDFIVQNSPHHRDVHHLYYALGVALNGRKDVRLWCDMRTDWQVEGIKPHGPDFGVFEGATTEEPFRVTTYKVKEDGTRPALVIEVTSEATRSHDLHRKVKEYFEAGVPLYVIVDYEPESDYTTAELICYRATSDGYLRLRPREDGRVWMAPVKLWLAWEEGQVACYDADNKRILPPVENKRYTDALERRGEEREQQMEVEIAARQDAERRANDEERHRLDAEKRARDEERQRLDAEVKAKDEERQRLDAEKRASDMAARTAELEAKLRGETP